MLLSRPPHSISSATVTSTGRAVIQSRMTMAPWIADIATMAVTASAWAGRLACSAPGLLSGGVQRPGQQKPQQDPYGHLFHALARACRKMGRQRFEQRIHASNSWEPDPASLRRPNER